MAEHDTPTPDDRAELIDAIDNHDLPWEVDEWWFESGKYEEPCLTLDVAWNDDTGGKFDADVVSTGTSAEQRKRIENMKGVVSTIEKGHAEGAPIQDVARMAVSKFGMDPANVHREIEKLRTKGEVYEPKQGHLRTT